MQENIDYELIPVENEDHWQIRIKTGEYIETVFQFGKLKVVNEEYMNFSYDLIYSPIEDLNEDLYLKAYKGGQFEIINQEDEK